LRQRQQAGIARYILEFNVPLDTVYRSFGDGKQQAGTALSVVCIPKSVKRAEPSVIPVFTDTCHMVAIDGETQEAAARIYSRLMSHIWQTCICRKIRPTMKKALRETQTLRAGCSKAEPKNFAPPQTRFPGAQDGQNYLEMVTTFTYKPNLVRIDARNFELSW